MGKQHTEISPAQHTADTDQIPKEQPARDLPNKAKKAGTNDDISHDNDKAARALHEGLHRDDGVVTDNREGALKADT